MESQALSAPKGVEEVIHSASSLESSNSENEGSPLFNQTIADLGAIIRSYGKNDQHAVSVFHSLLEYINRLLNESSPDDETEDLFQQIASSSNPTEYDPELGHYVVYSPERVAESVLVECGLRYRINEQELTKCRHSFETSCDRALKFILSEKNFRSFRLVNDVIRPLNSILSALKQ